MLDFNLSFCQVRAPEHDTRQGYKNTHRGSLAARQNHPGGWCWQYPPGVLRGQEMNALMPTITASQQHAIEQIVGLDRARFDRRERRGYSHDTGVLPGAFRVLAGASLADGVVQPETEDQLI